MPNTTETLPQNLGSDCCAVYTLDMNLSCQRKIHCQLMCMSSSDVVHPHRWIVSHVNKLTYNVCQPEVSNELNIDNALSNIQSRGQGNTMRRRQHNKC